MQNLLKKQILLALAGVVITTATVIPLNTTYAAAHDNNGANPTQQEACGPQHHHFDANKMAQDVSDTFGVEKKDVVYYVNEGVRPHEIFTASFFAKASGRSLKQVMEIKAQNGDWKEVIQKLNLSKDELKATKNDIVSTKLEKTLKMPKNDSLALLKNGYRVKDIAVADELSNNTKKPIQDILNMKAINNSWDDVAKNLGVSEDTWKTDMENVHTMFPHHEFGGHHMNHEAFNG